MFAFVVVPVVLAAGCVIAVRVFNRLHPFPQMAQNAGVTEPAGEFLERRHGMFFSRTRIAEAAGNVARHLQLVETTKSIEIAQRELANSISRMNERTVALEAELRTMKSEVRLDALKETQSMCNALGGSLSERIDRLENTVGVMAAALGEQYKPSVEQAQPQQTRSATRGRQEQGS